MNQTKLKKRTLFDTCLCGIGLGLVGLVLMPAVAPAHAPQPSSAEKAEVQSNYGKLPLSFEANQGQTDSQVKFLARGGGYALFLTGKEAVLSLSNPQAQAQAQAQTPATSSPGAGGTVLTMQLSGTNPAPRVTGKDALPGRVNYLRGQDPARWQTQIPTYAKVAYEGIYPGVDLVYYGNQGQLEYDFVVAPGADPGQLKLVFRGADRIEINGAGELVLHTPSSDIRMQAPVIYQEMAGVRTTVSGRYVLEEPQQVSFEVAAYDTSRPLVIDPVLLYATYLGGSGEDSAFGGIAVDNQGNAYVMGYTLSTDFPIVGAVQPVSGGGQDAFVVKLNQNGDQLLYSTYLGGSGVDFGWGIALDNSGNAYVTGYTLSTDFPTLNAVQPSLKGQRDAFVAKLSGNGDRLLYSTYLGGSGAEIGYGIALDNGGNAYITGYTDSTDFPTVDAVQPASGGGSNDAFVTKLNRDGNRLLYSTYLGGSRNDTALAIAVDNPGNAYVTGATFSTDFPTVGAVQPASGGGSNDAFVTKLNRDGNRLLYSTYLGGSSADASLGIAVDNQGNAYVTGYTDSTDFPTVGAVQPVSGGGRDSFVAKLNRNGDRLLYSTYLGGSGEDSAFGGIAVDNQGNAYVTGYTFSTNFPNLGAVLPGSGGGQDAFVAKLNRDGDRLLYSTYLGGSGGDFGRGIAVDNGGNAYVAGGTFSTDFPTVGAVQPASGGYEDAFVAKLNRSQ